MDPSGDLRFLWWLADEGAHPEGWLGTLLCLTLLTGRAPDRSLLLQDGRGAIRRTAPGDSLAADDVARVSLEDHAFGFALDILPEPAARLATLPVETLQRSEDRLESTYQGTIFAICWALTRHGAPRVSPGLRLAFRRLA